ncbi:MAG: IS5 family transposase [Deltaproteobacteria bacterium]|nr:IS5 family transposase [Deltaproteobacteria bacterium]
MGQKATYKVGNWKEYNRSLINRGNLTVWISDEAIATWNLTSPTGRKGRTKTYSDLAIETALTLRCLLGLPLRQTQGFLEGLIKLLDLKIDAPNYSTLSRRADSLAIDLGVLASRSNVDVAIDATGLKVYGEGEWKMRTHGKNKRRTWRKLHIAIDHKTNEIVAVTLTKSNVHDSMETSSLLDQIDNIASVTADKGYDNKNAYEPIAAKGAKAIIPPRSGAALKLQNPTWGDVERNRLVREHQLLGKDAWKSGSGYRRRVLVETSIGRYKRTIGASMHSRNLGRQKAEVRLGAKILNQMTHLGMPKSYKV